MAEDEVDYLRSRVTTQLDPGYELPRFPSPEDVVAFPRRMVYAPGPIGAACWHTAPAGSDASGRPGNVFAHVILDRQPAAERRIRPIEFWRSSDWLTPYGAEGVVAAELPVGVTPTPGTAVTTASVVDFLLDLSHFRLGTLGALLDACAAAMQGGPRVVLGSETADTAALWIGAVSFLMPVRNARTQFFFSTLERYSGVRTAFDNGVLLACVPRTDVASVQPRDGYTVIDELEAIEIGNLGGQPHRTESGHEITATEWSAIAQVILLDPGTAHEALQHLDAVTGDLEQISANPAWGLSIVVSAEPEKFSDAAPEAAWVLAHSSPPELPEPLFIQAAVLMNSQLGPSAGDAWAFLAPEAEGAIASGAMTQLLLGLYGSRAAADRGWFAGPQVTPTPPAGSRLRGAAARQVAEIALGSLHALKDADLSATDRGFTVARLANLVVQLGLQHPQLDEQLRDGLDGTFFYQLFADGASDLVDRLGPFAEATQATFIRPGVETDPVMNGERRPGSRLALRTLQWLYPDQPEPVRIELDLAFEGWRLRSELAAHLALWQPESPAFAAERPLGVWASLRGSDGHFPPELNAYFAGPAWDPQDLYVIERQYSGVVPIAMMAPTLKAAASGYALTELCRLLIWRTQDRWGDATDPAAEVAAMRYQLGEGWYRRTGSGFVDLLGQIMRGGAYASRLLTVPFGPDALDGLRAATIVSAVIGRHLSEVSQIRGALGDARQVISEHARQMVSDALTANVTYQQIIFAAMAADPKFPEPTLQDARFQWVDSAQVADGESVVPILKHHLLIKMTTTALDLEDLEGQVLDYAWNQLRSGGVENPDKSIRALERFAHGWTRNLQNTEERQSRRKARSEWP